MQADKNVANVVPVLIPGMSRQDEKRLDDMFS